EDRIAMALGGRVAEEVMFGEITSGAGDDIRRVTDIAKKMVTELGMSTRLGPRAFGQREEMVFLGRDLGEQRNYSEEMAGEIDEEIHAIVDAGYKKAKEILTRRKADMIKLAEYLKEVETIDGDDLDKILRGEEVIPSGPSITEQARTREAKVAKDAKEAERKAKEGARPFRPEPSPS
ncbi:MAG TPA: cell division protein FtsH, partial [Candidatus Solibacter sp.]|nr:cell division protein FtsH [Candidatus Solibacter sp.]